MLGSLREDTPLDILDQVVVTGGYGAGRRAHDATAELADNGDLLVAY